MTCFTSSAIQPRICLTAALLGSCAAIALAQVLSTDQPDVSTTPFSVITSQAAATALTKSWTWTSPWIWTEPWTESHSNVSLSSVSNVLAAASTSGVDGLSATMDLSSVDSASSSRTALSFSSVISTISPSAPVSNTLSTTASSASQTTSSPATTASATQTSSSSTSHLIVGLCAGLGIPLGLMVICSLMLLAWWHGRNIRNSNPTAADTNIHGRIRASFPSFFTHQQDADITDGEVKEMSATRSIAELAAEREAAELEARTTNRTRHSGVVVEIGSGRSSRESER